MTKTGLIKEEVEKNNDEFDHNIKSKTDNDSPRMENEIEQEKKEPVLVVNPRSGGGSTGKDWETLLARIKEALDKEPHFVFTEKSRNGTTLARELIKKGYQYIVAVGGDGTVNEVVNGFFIEENRKKMKKEEVKAATYRIGIPWLHLSQIKYTHFTKRSVVYVPWATREFTPVECHNKL